MSKYRRLDTRALHNQRLSIAAQVDREMEARLIARGYAMVPRADGNGCEIGGVSAAGHGPVLVADGGAEPRGREDGGGV